MARVEVECRDEDWTLHAPSVVGPVLPVSVYPRNSKGPGRALRICAGVSMESPDQSEQWGSKGRARGLCRRCARSRRRSRRMRCMPIDATAGRDDAKRGRAGSTGKNALLANTAPLSGDGSLREGQSQYRGQMEDPSSRSDLQSLHSGSANASTAGEKRYGLAAAVSLSVHQWSLISVAAGWPPLRVTIEGPEGKRRRWRRKGGSNHEASGRSVTIQ